MDPALHTLHHLSIVVHDLAATVSYYEGIGVGPWKDFPSLEAFRDNLTAPDPEGFLQLRYRYADLGNVQIQLCQPGPGDTPQRRFLETHGEGVFHLGFSVPEVDGAEAELTGLGLAPLLRGRTAIGTGFTYFDTRDRAGVVLQVRAAAPGGHVAPPPDAAASSSE